MKHKINGPSKHRRRYGMKYMKYGTIEVYLSGNKRRRGGKTWVCGCKETVCDTADPTWVGKGVKCDTTVGIQLIRDNDNNYLEGGTGRRRSGHTNSLQMASMVYS